MVDYTRVSFSDLSVGNLCWIQVQPIESAWPDLGMAWVMCEVNHMNPACIEVVIAGSTDCIPLHVVDGVVPLYRKKVR